MTPTLAAGRPSEGGLLAFSGDLLLALGDIGVGALVLLETVVPPIPSEVVLPYAGYLVLRRLRRRRARVAAEVRPFRCAS